MSVVKFVEVQSIRIALAKWDRDEDTAVCWRWTGATNNNGYGSHRYIWKRVFPNQLISELDLDHYLYPERCVGKLCVTNRRSRARKGVMPV